jgi:DNA repair protein RadA/Sms
MAKIKVSFVCQNCGAVRPKWEGQCRDCGAWNSFVEETVTTTPKNSRGWNISGNDNKSLSKSVIRLSDPVKLNEKARWQTGMTELNRVLGGGLVRGSYNLLGGDPGIGKSTLLMQMAGALAKQKLRVLYVSAEESVEQTALRAQRLGVREESVLVASESQLSAIIDLAEHNKPDVMIVDSIQTVYWPEIPSAPGTVSQVRECAAQLMSLAKGQNISIFLVGHVTKDGHIAGPKTLEHMVDTVLSFEGDANHQFRLLRAQKNRFGPTNELGVFQMSADGLEEVSNPSELFLADRGERLVGSAVFAAMEGTRPLLCEVQALTVQSYMPMPRRTSVGVEMNRLLVMAAVLDKHLEFDFAKHDVFVNVVGGLKIDEPAVDLAVSATMISSLLEIEIDARTCFFGEIGLTGEIRAASSAQERVREAGKLGFERVVLPWTNKRHIKDDGTGTVGERTNGVGKNKGPHLIYVKDLSELVNAIKNSQAKRKSEDKVATVSRDQNAERDLDF